MGMVLRKSNIYHHTLYNKTQPMVWNECGPASVTEKLNIKILSA